jgi:hypothetical protein
MFCKHVIKNFTCFGHYCLTILRGPSFVLSVVANSPLVCFVKLFIWYVAVCCLCVCVCVPVVPVCGLFYIPQTSTTACFALKIKRPTSLPTVRRCAKLEALAFDSRITSYSNATGVDTATATPCGQNSVTSQLD